MATHAPPQARRGSSFVATSPRLLQPATGAFVVQRQAEGDEPSNEPSRPPLIPIPIFDELDPMVIVPDVPGVPAPVRGTRIKLSTLRRILDVARGNIPRIGPGDADFCTQMLPGYETVRTGSLAGSCCPAHRRDPDVCCRPENIGLLDFRCCTSREVVIDNHCVQPQIVLQTPPLQPVPDVTLPEPQLRRPPRAPSAFGTIESETIDGFATGSSLLPEGAEAKLDLLARQIQLYADAVVHVDGHTDATATDAINRPLSNERAAAVRDALVARGVDPARLLVAGHAHDQPVHATERTPEDRAQDRRVDVWLVIPPSTGGLRHAPVPTLHL